MSKFIHLFIALSVSASVASAQTVTDSVSIGAGYANTVYYKLSDGSKTSTSNQNWHIAFTARPSQFPNNPTVGVIVRFNSQLGVKVYRVPAKTAADFSSTIDTTGISTWPSLYDTDSTFERGSFNTHTSSDPFNFGWGTYNQNTHAVVGDSLYVIKLPGGITRKLVIDELSYDTLWKVRHANLDGSNMVNVQVSKNTFANHNFAYYNLITDSLFNREPLTANWDLQFSRYAAKAALGPQTLFDYPVTGVLSNIGIMVAEARGVDKNTVSNFPYANSYSSLANVIGFDWKNPPAGPPPAGWTVVDSLAYFVKTKDGNIHKLVFTGFSGSGTGTYYFSKTYLATSVKENTPFASSLSVYPNPSHGQVQVVFSNQRQAQSQWLRITDMNGRTVMHTQLSGNFGLQQEAVDISALAKGLYIISIESEGASNSQRISLY